MEARARERGVWKQSVLVPGSSAASGRTWSSGIVFLWWEIAWFW